MIASDEEIVDTPLATGLSTIVSLVRPPVLLVVMSTLATSTEELPLQPDIRPAQEMIRHNIIFLYKITWHLFGLI